MPDIDRDALNRALAEALERADRGDLAYEPWTTCPECVQDDIRKPSDCPRCGSAMVRTPRCFTASLDAAVDALNALNIGYALDSALDYVSAWRRGARGALGSEAQLPCTDKRPAALATALVQAALQCLGAKEEDTDGNA